VDPGTIRLGFGITELSGEAKSPVKLITYGVVAPLGNPPLPERLKDVFFAIDELINTHKPSALALEDVFVSLNPRSIFKLSAARGVVMLAASLNGIPVYEYSPSAVKNSVCGYGRAEKSQVAFMVGKLLNISTEGVPPDASDALAVSITHVNKMRLDSLTKGEPKAGLPLKATRPGKSKSFRELSLEALRSMGYKID
jgi:crossover junction endodeoxyribonuclease RuvC